MAAALVAAFLPLREGGGGEHEQSGRRVDVPGLAGTQGSRVASENLISPRVIGTETVGMWLRQGPIGEPPIRHGFP